MSANTTDIERLSDSGSGRGMVELLSSMRFAISLLTVICIASVIGTVVKQAEPAVNYINQFGPFWAQLFGKLNLYTVYSAWWFLLILAFLVLSTSLCIARNAPKIFADLKAYKENIREQSFRAFPHRAEGQLAGVPQQAAQALSQALVQSGWKVKLQEREHGWMVAAKKGAANKLGYIAAHSAIVLVCIGGLLDGDLMVRLQMWWGDKAVFSGAGMIADVPPKYRLSASNPTFRGNVLVGEGTHSSTALLAQPGGVILQDLPFSIELRKFIVEYYSTGMPKLFASDIVIHDKQTGEAIAKRVEVNHPVRHRGIEIYQSGFDDGGSRVTLRAVPMGAAVAPFEVSGTIGGSTPLSNGNEQMTLEFSGLRVINVENLGKTVTDPRQEGQSQLGHAIEQRMGAANKTTSRKDLRNVGPSVSYKLRDAAGQAREYNNYMLPVQLEQDPDSVPIFLLGARETPADQFQYLRIPADPEGSKLTFLRTREALQDPALRERAVQRYVAQAIPAHRTDMVAQLSASALRALNLYAGVWPEPGAKQVNAKPAAGLQAISDFMEANVPQAERERASEVLIRILNGVLFELAQMSRQQAGLPPMESIQRTQNFMAQAVLSWSDAAFYPAPMAFELKEFEQVQASVFQVTRAPGRNVVYLGCLLLIVGIFAMLYVRERRLWIWLVPAASGSQASMALSSNRKTLDGDKEFEHLKNRLLQGSS
ncbi:MAG: cytochrome c biogenesis protein ResB [Comamonadaceae bacterium]|nr:cytochrome c biogenesis protein ResB [Comamonadaceae bacterium]